MKKRALSEMREGEGRERERERERREGGGGGGTDREGGRETWRHERERQIDR